MRVDIDLPSEIPEDNLLFRRGEDGVRLEKSGVVVFSQRYDQPGGCRVPVPESIKVSPLIHKEWILLSYFFY